MSAWSVAGKSIQKLDKKAKESMVKWDFNTDSFVTVKASFFVLFAICMTGETVLYTMTTESQHASFGSLSLV